MIEAFIIKKTRKEKQDKRVQPRLRSEEIYRHHPQDKREGGVKRGVEIVDFSI